MGDTVRIALGEIATIGSLYDAKLDRFLPASIITGSPPSDALTTTPAPSAETFLAASGTYTDRFNALHLSEETAASVVAKLVTPRGAGVYLRDVNTTPPLFSGAVHHKVSTYQQKLSLANPKVQECLDLAPLQSSESTHVVIGINWGLHSVTEIKHYQTSSTPSTIATDFDGDLLRLKDAVDTAIKTGRLDSALARLSLKYEITLYSDAFADEGLMLESPLEACTFAQLVPDHISQEKRGLGWPVSYILLPLAMLHHFLPLPGEVGAPYSPINGGHLAKFVNLFDHFSASIAHIEAYRRQMHSQKLFVPRHHLEQIDDIMANLTRARKDVVDQFQKLLVDVRSGRSYPRALDDLYNDTHRDHLDPRRIDDVVDRESPKIDFLSQAVAHGATYIGNNGLSVQDTVMTHGDAGCYAFLFTDESMRKSDSWGDQCALLMTMLTDTNRNVPVYIVDCDAVATELNHSTPRICRVQNGQETIPDILERQNFMADKSFARYQESQLEAGQTNKPVKRRFVKIPCPHWRCDPTRICEWTCPRCFVTVECGFTDDYIYCDCGRTLYNAFDFRCNSDRHGPEYEGYNPKTLHRLLLKLDQSDYVNILILGETGVGKSTFINAFINYLSYATLDEAKVADGLVSVIPCHFSIQVMNRNDPNQAIEEKTIQVGSRDDEANGAKGDSATQQTNVYSVNIGATTYRLIDTPGIGDTRGLSYDKKNMADILRTLGSYENLHGILVLLKSNNARLTITFRFCVKELLSHLHRSAAENMAFGFTNTRISNYTPGDTFGPLKTLLSEHSEIGLGLSTHTTYCFDSESFRYLAAYKNGEFLPNEEDFRRSWEHSRQETQRLINHFKSRKPHSVVSTISLNGARQLIAELTKPMAEISKLIRDNMMMLEDRKQQLKDTRLSADMLRKKLMLDKIQFNSLQLQKPRTVCKDTSCCDFKDSGKGDNETVTIYKTHCHAVCYLDDVQEDVVGHAGLIHCAAFGGSNICSKCGHRWMAHLHVLYELEEVMVQVKDTEIERQLQVNADDVTLRQAGIQDIDRLKHEYDLEHKQIQEAAARFGLFLKAYAMTPINDATLDYINMLIQDEEMKVQGGRQLGHNVDFNVKRLQSLKKDRDAHIELVNTLKENMKAPQQPGDHLLDEQGVDDLVKRLYSLKHFGKNLQSVKNTVAASHQATYRERPYRVPQRGGRPSYGSQSSWGSSGSSGASRPSGSSGVNGGGNGSSRQLVTKSYRASGSSSAHGGGHMQVAPRKQQRGNGSNQKGGSSFSGFLNLWH
jgi:hypothetical protein